MRALMDWSYDLLAPNEQSLFETLSIFAGGWTLAAATAVFAESAADVDALEVLGLLGSLVDKSLVVADLDGREARFRLLESAREYAREKLAARGEATSVARRHALVYLEFAERLDRAYEIEVDPAWFAQAADAAIELENWQAALGWALGERHDVLLGQRLIAALYPLWSGRFAGPAAMRQWVRRALDAVDAATPAHVVARLECAEAVLASFFHEDATALTSAESALARFRELGDAVGVARAQTVAALSFSYLGRPEHALEIANEGLETVRRLGHRPLAGWLLVVSGLARSMVGDFAGARACIAEAIAIYTEAGDDGRATMTRSYHLPNVEFRAGDAEAAARYAADALAHYRARSDLHAVTILSSWSAAYLVALGRYEEAEARAGEALSLARELGWRVMVAGALQRFAAIAILRPPHDGEVASANRADGARLLGFVDARLADLKATRRLTDRVEYERVLVAMTEAIGADELAGLMAAGANMTEDETIAHFDERVRAAVRRCVS
jgi:non-specific serine/threonine protein kinase